MKQTFTDVRTLENGDRVGLVTRTYDLIEKIKRGLGHTTYFAIGYEDNSNSNTVVVTVSAEVPGNFARQFMVEGISEIEDMTIFEDESRLVREIADSYQKAKS